MSTQTATLSELCTLSREACQAMAEMLGPFYQSIGTNDTSKLKSDKSVFTIAGKTINHMHPLRARLY